MEITLVAYVRADPKKYVLVKTQEHLNRSTRKKIHRDISWQKFPRWAIFANQEYNICFAENYTEQTGLILETSL